MTGTAFFGNAWQGSRASFGEVFPFAEALEFYRDARAREDFLFVEALETSLQRLQGKTSRSRKP